MFVCGVVTGAGLGVLAFLACLDPKYWETAALRGVAGGLSRGIVCISVVVVGVGFTGVGVVGPCKELVNCCVKELMRLWSLCAS